MAHDTASEDQRAVVDFLRDPASWPARPATVDLVETHGAIVFLAGEEAVKIKRAVRLPYLDFSTLEARHHYCQREIEINRGPAPGIYRDVVAIVRRSDGGLAFGGEGTPVEWAVRMHRFDEHDVLLHKVRTGGISVSLAEELADVVAACHATAPVVTDARDRSTEIVASLTTALCAADDVRVRDVARNFTDAASAALSRSADIRQRRAAGGHIRRCHGDLHLNNIVLWKGHPVPFDAIEFDEAIATIDTLYDLAFVLMDLERNGARPTANIVLNRYLWRTGNDIDLQGLAALPLYLGLRAGIRAMVALDRKRLGLDGTDTTVRIVATLAHALADLTPPPARMIAIGGLSGTGKTTLAKALAPAVGATPGAIHLRSDMERKRLAGVEPTERLPAQAYTAATSAEAYDRVLRRAETALAAGHCVVVDAVFASPAEREAVEQLARRTGAAFGGLWLEGPADALKARVAARLDDASDATPQVVDRQLGYDLGAITWSRLDATGSADDVVATARGILGLTGR